jgi:hypothetical protein
LFWDWYRRVSNETQQYPESWKELEKYSKSFPTEDGDKNTYQRQVLLVRDFTAPNAFAHGHMLRSIMTTSTK